jgi:flagellar biosynthesis/type III secretory pathway M-ring protein FliF/YscJ
MKKGQSLPLNIIIIAAIVLIVLVVLWAIFTGRMGLFTKGLTDEEKKAQDAAKQFEAEAASGGTPIDQLSPCTSFMVTGTECKCARTDGTFNRCTAMQSKACGTNGACPS